MTNKSSQAQTSADPGRRGGSKPQWMVAAEKLANVHPRDHRLMVEHVASLDYGVDVLRILSGAIKRQLDDPPRPLFRVEPQSDEGGEA